MTTRLLLAHLTCLALFAVYQIRGFPGAVWYLAGLLLCLLIEPVRKALYQRWTHTIGLIRFEREAELAYQAARQQIFQRK